MIGQIKKETQRGMNGSEGRESKREREGERAREGWGRYWGGLSQTDPAAFFLSNHFWMMSLFI